MKNEKRSSRDEAAEAILEIVSNMIKGSCGKVGLDIRGGGSSFTIKGCVVTDMGAVVVDKGISFPSDGGGEE